MTHGGVRAGAVLVAAALATGALATGACAVDGSADPALYRDVLYAGAGDAVPADAPGTPQDVVLSMRLANAANETLRVEGEAYVRVLLERRRVAARFLARFDLEPEVSLDERTGHGRHSGLDAPVRGDFALDPVADSADTDAAALDALRARAELLAAQDALLLDTARAHFAVLRAERRADVLRASIAFQGARIDDARARVEAGVARPLDVALSESRAADSQVALVAAETEAREARNLLGFLTARDATATPLAPPVARADDTRDVAALRAAALAARPEVEAAACDVDAQAAGVRAAYGRFWPSIEADFTGFLSRDSEPTALDWTSAVRISLPLFDAGLIELDVRTALSRLRAAHATLALVRRSVARDVDDALEHLDAARRRIDALHVRRAAAERSREQAEGLWAAGLGTNLERLAAQDELLSADLDLTDAELLVALRRLELLRATGELHTLLGLVRDDAEARRAEAR